MQKIMGYLGISTFLIGQMTLCAWAENWEYMGNEEGIIHLDKDSVSRNGDIVGYRVKDQDDENNTSEKVFEINCATRQIRMMREREFGSNDSFSEVQHIGLGFHDAWEPADIRIMSTLCK